MIQSGKLNKRITIGHKVSMKDKEGFQSWDVKPFARPWAYVRNSSEPAEINEQKEAITKERITFTIYYRDGITNSMYIIFNNKYYQIKSIFNPNFENETLVLTAVRDNSRGVKNE